MPDVAVDVVADKKKSFVDRLCEYSIWVETTPGSFFDLSHIVSKSFFLLCTLTVLHPRRYYRAPT